MDKEEDPKVGPSQNVNQLTLVNPANQPLRRFCRLIEVATACCLATESPFEFEILPDDADGLFIRGYVETDPADDSRASATRKSIQIEIGSTSQVFMKQRMADTVRGVDDFTLWIPPDQIGQSFSGSVVPNITLMTSAGLIANLNLQWCPELAAAWAIRRLFPEVPLNGDFYNSALKTALADAVREEPESLSRLANLAEQAVEAGTTTFWRLSNFVASLVIHPESVFEDCHGGGAWSLDMPELLRLCHATLVPLDARVEIVLAGSPFIPEDLALVMARSLYHEEEHGTAERLAETTESPSVLAQISLSAISSARYAVAGNRFASALTLRRLAEDPDMSDSLFYCSYERGEPVADFLTMVAVLRNPSCPNGLVEQFASGSITWTLEAFEKAHGSKLFDDDDEAAVQELLRNEAQEILHERSSSDS